MLEFLEKKLKHELWLESVAVQVAAGYTELELCLPLEEIEGYTLCSPTVPCEVSDVPVLTTFGCALLFKYR